MLTYRVIPCLDVAARRVVKGVRFTDLRDTGCPYELATRYEAEGADEIVLLDVMATCEDRLAAIETVKQIRRALSIPLTVGGGARSADAVFRLLDAGADKVAVNSAAVANPRLITQMAERFGRQCTIVAIDASAVGECGWRVRTHSGHRTTQISAIDWAREAECRGAGEILLTSWDRDGTRSGFDLALLSAVTSAVRVPVIASGGASVPDDFVDAVSAGASAVLAASIFHNGEFSIRNVKRTMTAAGLEVRP